MVAGGESGAEGNHGHQLAEVFNIGHQAFSGHHQGSFPKDSSSQNRPLSYSGHRKRALCRAQSSGVFANRQYLKDKTFF